MLGVVFLLFFSKISFGNTFFNKIYNEFKKEYKTQVEKTLGIAISDNTSKINNTPIAATCDGTINNYTLDWSQMDWISPNTATPVANIRSSGNLSGYISSFNFMKFEPIPPSCPFTCEAGEMKLDFADTGWNGGTGWTDHDQTNPQTYMNFDGQGNNVTATFSGNTPSGGQPGPNVYSGNPQGCSEALRLTASNLSTSVAEFPTETLNFDQPINYHQLYVGGMEQRNGSGRAEVSVVSFSNNGTLIDPSGFTFGSLVATDVDYQIYNNEIYVYGTTENSDGLLSIETNGILIDEIKWSIGEITDNSVTPDMYTFTGGASSQWISPFCYTSIPLACELNLSFTQSSCTDNTDGTFTATYDLDLSWSNPPNTGDLTLTHYGDGTLNTAMVSAATIAGSNSTTLSAALTIPADGNGNTGILAAFDNDSTCKDSISIKAPTPCPNDVAPCSSNSGCIGGNVFEDYNCNGQDDTNESGIQGIEVQIYDCNNSLVGTGYSDADGDWQVCGLTDGTVYRVEFVLPEAVACWATPTHVGSDNKSDIQFLTAPACTKFSLNRPSNYCESNPLVGLSCFVGQPHDGIYADSAAIVSFRVENSGETDDPGYIKPTVLATHNQVGSVWGHARNQLTQESFYAAYLKRGAGMGPSGTGAIYKIDAAGTVSTYVDINSIFPGNPAGADPHTYSGDPTTTNYDMAPIPFIGKIAFGDIDLSITGDTLFAVNLNDKQLYLIPTTEMPTASNVTTISLPQPTDCIQDDTRPFGLGIDNDGRVYVGYVCGNESGTSPDGLEAYVYRWNGGSSFSNVLQFDLTFDRGTGNFDWANWGNNPGNTPTIRDDDPMFSDIEFEGNDMILGFRNRLGDKAYRPSLHVSGDIYKACWNGNSWDFEQGGSCGGIVGAYPGTVASPNSAGGPGGGHFYDNVFSGIVSQGSVFSYIDNQVVDVVIDPYGAVSAGLFTYDANGGRINRYEVYQTEGSTPGEYTFGKINGLGDLESLCSPAPIEIGNYVWCDSLQNGIQDACERGINDIIIQLYDRNGNLVGQDTTSNGGQYYFNENNVDTTGITVDGSGLAAPASGNFTGMSYNTQYFIVFGNGQFVTDEFTINGETYGVTAMANAGSNDNIDSDVDGNNLSTALNAIPAGLPFINMTTSATGCGDHKYDLGLSCQPPCNLTITPTQTDCTDNNDGTFTATYDLLVNWENPPATGDITLTHFGNGTLTTTTISAATISSVSSTTLSGALTIPADGNGNTGILAAFDNDASCKDSIALKAPTPCSDDVTPCSNASGCLGGNAFNDFNCNGIDDTEPGVEGVQVEVYDCTNMLVETTYTDSDGDWQICNLTNQEAYRVEFILPESIACWATPTHNGSDNGTNVQFLTAPACTQFSLSNPGDYCQVDVNLASSCYVSGDQINGPNANLETMIAFPYDAMGPVSASTAPEHVAVANQIGSTFGLAYHKQTQTLLTASYYKYYTGFGPSGQDAIYAIEPGADAIPGTSDDVVSTFIEFDNIFGANSTGPDVFAAPYETNGDSTLNGKVAFGDIDFSNDNSELYVMNLGDRSIYTIPVSGSPLTPNTTAIQVSPPFPESSDCSSTLRPFAIEVAPDGKVYVGAVCENLSRRIYVWGYDPVNNLWDVEPSLNNIFTHYTGWCCWGSWDNTNFNRGALFTGLEIDAEGDLTIALRHRETDTNLQRNVGDIFKACKNENGIWIMENNAVCGNQTGSRPDVNQGPGRGEFYDDGSADGPDQSIMGGLTLLRGRGDVVATFDDAFQTYTLGALWLDINNGTQIRAYEAGRVTPLEPNEINGKQAVLGELEAYCDPAPLEIGNYIWCDLLENGIQDGCESGLDGILVQLYDRNGILVGQDTSAASGQYYFNQNNVDTTGITIDGSGIASPNSGSFTGMSYNTEYFIVFGNNQFVGDIYIVGSDSYVISPMNNVGSNDNIDSDVDGNNLTSGSLGNRPDGFPFISLTTNAQGCGNHNFDLGLNCNPAPLFSLGNRVFFDEDNSGDQNGVEPGIDGVQLQLLNADGTIYDSDPNTAGTQALIVTTANDGYYRFDDLPVGNYIVEILATNFDQGNPLAQAQSSTGANQEATPNSNIDINDNGLDTLINGAIRSGIISLFPDEPINETDEPGTYGAGSTTGTAAVNELSNLTVDFGFSPIDADYTNAIPGFPPCPEQPCHIVNDDLKMGDMISSEAPDAMGSDDADGTVFPNNLRAGTTINVRTTITNNTGNDAYLYAWVDWNDDDDFDDAGENFIAATYPSAMFSGTFEVINSVFIPSSTNTTDQIAIRFRLSSDQIATSSPCGSSTCAADGEIEDYLIQLECPQTICLPTNIQIIQN